jgi:hypothetical protein
MKCANHFADTGFLDLLPLAEELARSGGYDDLEIIEAIVLTFDKAQDYPPTKNRRKWFQIVFTEKLAEARAQIARMKWEQSRKIRSGQVVV